MGTKSGDSDNKETSDTFWTTNDDIESLIDEAKTMISLGSYNENIVNLQGISYEVDHSYDTLKQVLRVFKPFVIILYSIVFMILSTFYYMKITIHP